MIDQVHDEPAAEGADAPAADQSAETKSDLQSALYDQLMQGSDSESAGDDAEAAPQSAPDEDTADRPDEPGEDPAQDDPAPAVQRPASWSADKEGTWTALPREAQEFIAEREQNVHRELSRLGRTAGEAEPVLKELKPYESMFRRLGMSTAEGVATLARAQAMLETDPVSGIAQIAESYGVNLAMLANGTNEQISQMQRELAALKTEQRLAAERQAAEQNDNVSTAYQKWASEGKEYLSEVRTVMASLLESMNDAGKTPEQVLDEAYERAIWSVPEVREKLLAKEREAKAAEAAKAKRTEDAKKNKRTNMGSVGLPFITDGKFDRDNFDHMSRLYDKIAGQ